MPFRHNTCALLLSAAALSLFGISRPAAACTPAAPGGELVTDRPDITESSVVVGRGIWQLESGVSVERNGKGPAAAQNVSAPMALLRLGVSPCAELRLGADGLVSSPATLPGTRRANGMSDVTLGFKYVVASQARLGVDLAVIPFVSLPTGSNGFSSDSVDPVMKLTWARDLPLAFSLSGNVNVASTTVGDERFSSTEVMASLGHELTGGWSGFWEAYRASALEPAGSPAWLADAGITRPLGADAQLDLSIGHGLTEAAPSWTFGIGISVRGKVRK